MITKKILIFGASGQVGRYCIRRFVKNNYKVIAVTRNSHKKGYMLKTQAPIGYLDIIEANIFDEIKLIDLISEVDVCLNLIGILHEKGKINTFKNIHSNFPKKLAEICNIKKVKLIHISALGLENAKDSKYAKSKISGENFIRNVMPDATIIKPSLVYSVDDNLTTKFMSLLSVLPIFPLYYGGKTKFTPIHVSELAELIFYVISRDFYSSNIEAIGPEILTFKEILQKLMKCIKKNRILLPIPLYLSRLSAFFMQVLPEPLITQDQINLLKYDNIKTVGGTTNFDIGCPSTLKFEETVMKYAFNWTEGGQFSNLSKT